MNRALPGRIACRVDDCGNFRAIAAAAPNSMDLPRAEECRPRRQSKLIRLQVSGVRYAPRRRGRTATALMVERDGATWVAVVGIPLAAPPGAASASRCAAAGGRA